MTEAATPGWDLTGLACEGDAGWERDGATANLDVEPGEEITCTFTNTKRGSVHGHQTEAGGTPAGEWTFRLTGGPDNVDLAKIAHARRTPRSTSATSSRATTPCARSTCRSTGSPRSRTIPTTGTAPKNEQAGTADRLRRHHDRAGRVGDRSPSTTRGRRRSVVKEGNLLVHDGDTITYTFDVSNKGNTPLENVSVVDPKCDSAHGPAPRRERLQQRRRRAARAGRHARRHQVRGVALHLHEGAGRARRRRGEPGSSATWPPRTRSTSRATRSPTPMTTRRRSSTRASSSTRSSAARATATGPTARPATTRSRSTWATRSSTASR